MRPITRAATAAALVAAVGLGAVSATSSATTTAAPGTYEAQAAAIGALADAQVSAQAAQIAALQAQNAALVARPTPTVTVTQTVTATPSPSPTVNLDPSGQALPGAEPAGWTRVYAANDWTGVDLQAAFNPYPANWPDTSRNGVYSAATNTVATPGLLTVTLKTDSAGVRRVTALQPNAGKGQLYGRYSVRAKMTSNGRGYKTAWLLWPDDGQWPAHGEIDWPEGNIPGAPSAFMHWATPSGGQDAYAQTVRNDTWHTYTTEWSPGRVVFYLDGQVVGTATKLVPSTPMHWVLQSETELGSGSIVPAASTVATIQIDWIDMATRA